MDGGERNGASSLVAGPASHFGPLDRRSLVTAIAARVAQVPTGRLWNLSNVERPRSRTYRELWERSGRTAAALVARGLPAGSRIVLLVEDSLDFLPAFWACLRAGHIAVPLGSLALQSRIGERGEFLADVLASAAPALVIADDEAVAQASPALSRTGLSRACIALPDLDGCEAVLEEPLPAELACLLPTSGSTGAVKLVAIGQRAMLHRCFAALDAPVADKGAYINTFPVDSTTGIRCFALAHREFVQLPMSAVARSPTSLFDAVEMLRAWSFSITNTVADFVIAAVGRTGRRWDLSSLGQVATGSEAVLPSTMRNLDRMLRRFGAPGGIIRAGYGATETGPLVAGVDPLAPAIPGNLGVPLGGPAPNVAIRIVDETGTIAPEGAEGEVEICAPLKMFSHYWGDAEATTRAFTADGWWRTGDTGLLWGGQLALRGRTKEVFIANGRKHALGAIDDAMREALDPGEAAYACVVPASDEAPEALGVALVSGSMAGRESEAEVAVRQAIGRVFGVGVAKVRILSRSDLPLAATGKIKRADLAALLAAPDTRDVRPWIAPAATALDRIWETVLGSGSAADRQADFFALGGESLRSFHLFQLVERDLGVAVDPSLFFAAPTLATLAKLVAVPRRDGRADEAVGPWIWPLDPALYRGLLIFTETWPGERPTEDRLVAGFNTAGTKPPLFLVCQVEHEVRDLARALGPDQPVYGLRSGAEIIRRLEHEHQALALRYAEDVASVAPAGPVLVCGICQGGLIALALAQHLLRRGRHVPLLVLVDWRQALQPYAGRVMFVYGRDSPEFNPYMRFCEPETGWRRHCVEASAVELPGGHEALFDPAHVEATAAALAAGFADALRLPTVFLAAEHARAVVRLGSLPARMAAGERLAVTAMVLNASSAGWSETAMSGLVLASRWVDETGAAVLSADGCSSLPPLAPGVAEYVLLPVVAPRSAGKLTLIVDIVEEGSFWFDAHSPGSAARAGIEVVKADPGVADPGGAEAGRAPSVPGLRLLVDGLPTCGHEVGDERCFVVPAAARRLRLVSPTFRAAPPDERRLGVALYHVEVRSRGMSRVVPLDDPALASGFHPVEGHEGARQRWTNGDAVIDRGHLTRLEGDLLLVLLGNF